METFTRENIILQNATEKLRNITIIMVSKNQPYLISNLICLI